MLIPDASGAGPRDLVDDDGTLVARVVLADRGDWRQADVERLAPGVAAEVAASVMARVLAGTRVATLDAELARELVARGGAVTRAGTQLELALAADRADDRWLRPRLPAGAVLTPYDVDDAVAAARVEAYGPGHPDHDRARGSATEAADELRRLVAGDVTGPLLGAASVVARTGPEVLGGVVVTLMPPNPLWTGPWIADVFVTPAHQGAGVGAALLRYAAAATARAGHPAIALTVTDRNPARRLYERLGFTATHSFTTVALPAEPG